MIDPAALFSEHHPALFRYLSRMTGDPDLAEDAVQQAFMRLIEKPPAPGNVRAWLFQVAINAARFAQRTHGRRARILNNAPQRAPVADVPASPDAVTEQEEERSRVRRALDALSERDRTILLMREEGFSYREIAEAVGTTTQSVGTLISRAMAKLAAELRLEERCGSTT